MLKDIKIWNIYWLKNHDSEIYTTSWGYLEASQLINLTTFKSVPLYLVLILACHIDSSCLGNVEVSWPLSHFKSEPLFQYSKLGDVEYYQVVITTIGHVYAVVVVVHFGGVVGWVGWHTICRQLLKLSRLIWEHSYWWIELTCHIDYFVSVITAG